MYPTQVKSLGTLILCCLVSILLLGLSTDAHSGKNLKGNGFPAGFHFNLNLLGKKTQAPGVFNCPSEADYRCHTDDDGIIPCDPNTEECIQVTDDSNAQFFCHEDSSQNVVFIPRYDENTNADTSVAIQSGSTKGGKNKSLPLKDLDGDGIPDLQVTDWCTESFPDSDGADGAVVSLPPYDSGYAVFARVTGKPCNNVNEAGECVTGTMFTNNFGFVTDDQGNDLLALGFVDGSGSWQSFNLTREQDGTKTKGPGGKGVRQAQNISDAFTFTGSVCYISPGDQRYFCGEEITDSELPENSVDSDNDGTTDYWLPLEAWFWDDPDDNGDGLATVDVGNNGEDDWADVTTNLLETYMLTDYTTAQGCSVNAYCYNATNSNYEMISSTDEFDACVTTVEADVASGAVPSVGFFEQWNDPNKLVVDAPAVGTCKSWENEWIFSIADFVEYIWGIDNKGSYNIQVRFYPYDDVCDQLPGGCSN
ncbi:hypothetical protein ACMXYN_14440 [Neptuniibacter sp. PT8_73]|uniref:hypothetical protein n=1 Tax=unclassified Neptuniibacter TaxID=2630693 RepID=UPI0039F723C2